MKYTCSLHYAGEFLPRVLHLQPLCLDGLPHSSTAPRLTLSLSSSLSQILMRTSRTSSFKMWTPCTHPSLPIPHLEFIFSRTLFFKHIMYDFIYFGFCPFLWKRMWFRPLFVSLSNPWYLTGTGETVGAWMKASDGNHMEHTTNAGLPWLLPTIQWWSTDNIQEAGK